MRKRRRSVDWLVMIAVATVAGCGSDGSSKPSGTSRPVDVNGAEGVPHHETPGAQVLLRSGCLACHRVGSSGNDGPGSNLTHVGAKRDADSIRRMLIDPVDPMPSFRSLPREDLRVLVEYLSDLR